MAPATLEHARQQREGELGDGRDVEPERVGELLDVDRRARPEWLDGRGIVDEDVDPAQLVDRTARERRPGPRRAEVGDDRDGTASRVADGRRRRGELVLGAGDDGDASPALGELHGDRTADAAAAAGDQSGLVFEFGHGERCATSA
jgi:hypothetical protein